MADEELSNGTRQLILIVDDYPQNLQVLANTLSREECSLAAAVNGKQALDFTTKYKPDLILLDIMMPDIDGYEVCAKLKSDPATRDIPVIFLTARSETDDLVRGFNAGAVDYITKPFNSAELLARVRTHLLLKKALDSEKRLTRELQQSLEKIKVLSGLLPICSNCKKIRDDNGYWTQVDDYMHTHSDLEFSHSICPDCMHELYPEIADKLLNKSLRGNNGNQ